ncbi:hypothetical protein M409DRAFT_49748 [Zasmidium cellare ATCC 36951]|uniref:Tyrosinase copper-binding domain-containing protein n=1 Tax=Zasmidium cellare ATCC 36951 TaxID=1080233 RepID=A0A6A6D2G4_ZASCE|nr:uncharacterized protein M409DRAFT_49748 [Zasmidium cellare ATCC 36951]KAF2173283.1 hypothetical protein M409DRAFT_49748 [Zasmidium cellare ATCC 36951]
MRCSRWLLAASLGVGALARVNEDADQPNTVHHRHEELGEAGFEEWVRDLVDEIEEGLDDDDDEDKRSLQEANDISGRGNFNLDQVVHDAASSLIQELEIDVAENGFEDIAETLSEYEELNERQVDPTTTVAPPVSPSCAHCASPAVSKKNCNICHGSKDAPHPVERNFKPFPPKPEDLVTKIPADVTPGWTSTSKTRTNGHRWNWKVMVYSTEPTGFAVTYKDHHHHTTLALGQYDAALQPPAFIWYTANADRNALDVLRKAQHHNTTHRGVAARNGLEIDELFTSIVAPDFLLHAPSSLVSTYTTEAQGHSATATLTFKSPDVDGTFTVDDATFTAHGKVDLAATPPVVVATMINDDEILTTTIPLSSSDVPAETGMPIAKRLYGVLPTRVTPGQVYTHTNVENGESTTATIKVTATKPNTGFAVTLHSGSFTRTVNAHIVKTATPPVIVQTLTVSGVGFVQTDVWGSQKAHAYLPHATSHPTGSKHGASHFSKPTNATASSAHASNGTLAAPAVSTIVETHIQTKTVKAGGTLTITQTLSEEPIASEAGWTVTANRHGYRGLFSLPSSTPDAMLQTSNCNATELLKLDVYNEEIRFLRGLTWEQKKTHYAYLGWNYIESLIKHVHHLNKILDPKEVAARAIYCMRHEIDPLDTCPCNTRARPQLNAPHPAKPAVTTEFIARFGPGLLSHEVITPPATLTDGGKTMKFELAEDTSEGESHKTHRKHHSSKHHSDDVRHSTSSLRFDALEPLQTMTVFLDDVPPAILGMPKCEKEATPQCMKDDQGKRNKTECKIEKCMWKFVKPINITTALPALMTDPYGTSTYFDYFTHITYISGRPHWGTTSTAGIYYPMGYNTTIDEGVCTNKTAYRESRATTVSSKKAFPQSMLGHLTDPKVQGDPECWNRKTCRRMCEAEVKRSSFFGSKTAKVLMAVLGALGGLLILALLGCCCLTLLHRRHKKTKKEEREGNSVMGGHAVDPVTGREVDPATGTDAVTAGSALGPATAAAAAKPGARNAGTLGRQAEEGRGRVHFPNESATAAGAAGAGAVAGEKAHGGEKSGKGGTGITGGGATEAKGTGASGAGKGAAVASEKVAVEPAKHVETVAAHDGADSRRAGSEMADTGSMRGRRPNRQDEQGLI